MAQKKTTKPAEQSARKPAKKPAKRPAAMAVKRPAKAPAKKPAAMAAKAPRDPRAPRYWLMKSEPDVYSIDDLARDGSTTWEGVRNYTARNFMRDEMALGDPVLFYHSNAEPPGIAGLGKIVGLAEPDPFQFDPKSPYHDPDAKKDDPRWVMVRVGFDRKLPKLVSLDRLKAEPRLHKMLVVQKGQRLSVQPVEREHFELVLTL